MRAARSLCATSISSRPFVPARQNLAVDRGDDEVRLVIADIRRRVSVLNDEAARSGSMRGGGCFGPVRARLQGEGREQASASFVLLQPNQIELMPFTPPPCGDSKGQAR